MDGLFTVLFYNPGNRGADGSLVGPPDFKSGRRALITSAVGSIPTRSRHALPAGGEAAIPYANIRITETGVTREQKAAVIKGVPEVLVKVLGKDPASTFVIIDEVETDNRGIGGESITARGSKIK